MMENPIKMDDLGVPLNLETPIYTPKFNMEPENDGFKKESPFPVFFR